MSINQDDQDYKVRNGKSKNLILYSYKFRIN